MNMLQNEMKEIIELLYQEKKDAAYDKLGLVIPHLSNCIDGIQDNSLQVELIQVLTQAMQAMEEENLTLLADILQYDLMENFL